MPVGERHRLYRVTGRRIREAHRNIRPISELSLHLDFDVYGSRSSNESRFRRRKVIDICGPSRELCKRANLVLCETMNQRLHAHIFLPPRPPQFPLDVESLTVLLLRLAF